LQPNLLGVDTVSHSYGSGMNRLIAHLVALGHERIGLIYGMGEQSASMDGARLEEYEAELINAGIPVDHNLIYRCGTKIEDGIAAAEALLQHRQRPTALIAINDLLAHGAMRAAQKLGLRIPHDVSIAGFDNITFSKYSYPSLTTVTSNPKKMGIVAVRMLLDRLSDPYLPVRLVTIPSRLVIRESTGPVPDEVAK
jgi:DNA-binding LacI/PurR family transcriptional regulator